MHRQAPPSGLPAPALASGLGRSSFEKPILGLFVRSAHHSSPPSGGEITKITMLSSDAKVTELAVSLKLPISPLEGGDGRQARGGCGSYEVSDRVDKSRLAAETFTLLIHPHPHLTHNLPIALAGTGCAPGNG